MDTLQTKDIGDVRPSTAKNPTRHAIKKPKVVDVTDNNVFALVDEVYNLQNKSFFDQRMIQVRN